jgi:high affinity Mn2+ porin
MHFNYYYYFNLLHAQDLIENNSDINLHFQQTVVTQGHPSFSAKYSGANSLDTNPEAATSLFFEGNSN